MNNNCPLRVINRDRLVAMGLASIMLIIGTVLLRVYIWLGISIIILAWLFVIYNLFQTIPDKAPIFIPAIVLICISYLMFETTGYDKTLPFIIYGAAWLTLGWVMSSEIDDTWLGPFAALLIAGSNIFIMPWQQKNNIVYGIGLPLISTGLTLVSIIHAYPTIETIKAVGPECLADLATKIPQLQPYVNDINCVLETGCFDTLSTLPASESAVYIAAVTEAVTCAGQQCDIFKQLSTEIDCFITSCLPTILKTPPTTPLGWVSAILLAYTTCGIPTCKLPSIS